MTGNCADLKNQRGNLREAPDRGGHRRFEGGVAESPIKNRGYSIIPNHLHGRTFLPDFSKKKSWQAGADG
jgi:hypothetical protein